MSERTNIVIADDQELFALGLKTVIESSRVNFCVVSIAGSGIEAVEAVRMFRPQVLLMDVRMPGMDGVEATRIIHERFPEVKILILTSFHDDEYVLESLKYGASGYLLKDRPAEVILDSIRAPQVAN